MSPIETPSTAEQILAQFYIAFGQGAGSVRVSRSAVVALRSRYWDVINQKQETWGTDGVQVLERIRALGRLSALLATQAGRTNIVDDDFRSAARKVENPDGEVFVTDWCQILPRW